MKKEIFNPHMIEPFEVAGTEYYQEEIMAKARPNKKFKLSAQEILYEGLMVNQFIDEYYIQLDDIELVYEPTNKHDKNAIMVMANGLKIGYVPAELCTEIKNILKKYDVDHITSRVFGGWTRHVTEDNKLIRNCYGNYEITLYITLKERPSEPKENKINKLINMFNK